MKVTFLGHACFLFEEAGTSILTDPYLEGNPQASARPAEVNPTYILVSHAHGDHLGDAVDISKRTGATIISTAEVARACQEKGAKTHSMHIGGKKQFDFGFVRITPAFHGSGVAAFTWRSRSIPLPSGRRTSVITMSTRELTTAADAEAKLLASRTW